MAGVSPWFTTQFGTPNIRVPETQQDYPFPGRVPKGKRLGQAGFYPGPAPAYNFQGEADKIGNQIAKAQLRMLQEQLKQMRTGGIKTWKQRQMEDAQARMMGEQLKEQQARSQLLQQQATSRANVIGEAMRGSPNAPKGFRDYNRQATLRTMAGNPFGAGGSASMGPMTEGATGDSFARQAMAARQAQEMARQAQIGQPGGRFQQVRGAGWQDYGGYNPAAMAPYQQATMIPSTMGRRQHKKGTVPGTVPKTGPAIVHKNEVVVSADQVDSPLLAYLIRDKQRKMESGQMDGKGTGPGADIPNPHHKRKKGEAPGFQEGSLFGRGSGASYMTPEEEQQAAIVRELNRRYTELGSPKQLPEGMYFDPGYLDQVRGGQDVLEDIKKGQEENYWDPQALVNIKDFWLGQGPYEDTTLMQRIGGGFGGGAEQIGKAGEAIGRATEQFGAGFRGDAPEPEAPPPMAEGGVAPAGPPSPEPWSGAGTAADPYKITGEPDPLQEGGGVRYDKPQIAQAEEAYRAREKADRVWKYLEDNHMMMSPEEFQMTQMRAKRLDQFADRAEKRVEKERETRTALQESERESKRSLDLMREQKKAEGRILATQQQVETIMRTIAALQEQMIVGDSKERQRAAGIATEYIMQLSELMGQPISQEEAQRRAIGMPRLSQEELAAKMREQLSKMVGPKK